MMLTTAHRWLANSESKAYLPVILHRGQTGNTASYFLVKDVENTFIAQYWKPVSHICEQKGKQAFF